MSAQPFDRFAPGSREDFLCRGKTAAEAEALCADRAASAKVSGECEAAFTLLEKIGNRVAVLDDRARNNAATWADYCEAKHIARYLATDCSQLESLLKNEH